MTELASYTQKPSRVVRITAKTDRSGMLSGYPKSVYQNPFAGRHLFRYQMIDKIDLSQMKTSYPVENPQFSEGSELISEVPQLVTLLSSTRKFVPTFCISEHSEI